MFERYWIEQFPDLLNKEAVRGKTPTPTARKIIEAIQGDLGLAGPEVANPR